jgi:hypothetical protein
MTTKTRTIVSRMTMTKVSCGVTGGRFFKLTAGPRFLLFGSEMLEITASDKSAFYGWLYEHSGLSTKEKDGKAIVEGCLAEAQRRGTALPWATWVRVV